ncbi:MAG: hypothetical protein PHQ60_11125 [Sideroxydans sp.]|nr:hypothetical protein [Sideroxydans sp.]
MNNRLLVVLLAVLGVAAAPVAAEQLPDPTRPAIELVPGLSEGAASQVAPPQGLQSVILSPKREAAIINGIEVERGGKFGDAVLTEVNESCVVLIGAEGRRVMYMFPSVKMTKNQRDCVRQRTLQPIGRAADKPLIKVKARVKAKHKAKPKAKKRTVICVPVEEYKNGSGK